MCTKYTKIIIIPLKYGGYQFIFSTCTPPNLINRHSEHTTELGIAVKAQALLLNNYDG